MGSSNSKPKRSDMMRPPGGQQRADYMPGVEYTSDAYGLSGDPRFRAQQKANAIIRPSSIPNAGQVAVMPLTDLDMRSNGWITLPHKVPVRVTIAAFGTGVTKHYRYNKITGIPEYAIHQLHPLNPQEDIIWTLHLVPAIFGGESVIRRLRYAVAGFLPSENVVKFVTDEGKTFPVAYNEVQRITDPDIVAALSAFESDYPTATGGLMFAEIETPQFQSDSGSADLPNQSYQQLANPENADKLADMWKKQRECLLPRPPPPISMVPVVGIVPDCSKSKEIPSALGGPNYRTGMMCDPRASMCGFDDVSPMLAVAASSETTTSGLAPAQAQQTKNIGSQFMDGANFDSVPQQGQSLADMNCSSGLTDSFFTFGDKKYPIYSY